MKASNKTVPLFLFKLGVFFEATPPASLGAFCADVRCNSNVYQTKLSEIASHWLLVPRQQLRITSSCLRISIRVVAGLGRRERCTTCSTGSSCAVRSIFATLRLQCCCRCASCLRGRRRSVRPKRHRGDSNPCGQSPMDFEPISLTARTQCHL